MIDILVRPPELRRTADGLRACAKKIERSIESIDHELNSLKGEKFLGIRSDALQRNYVSKRDSLINSKNLVLQFATDLENAALAFEIADNASSARTTSPLSSVEYVANVPPRTYALLSRLAYSDSLVSLRY